MDPAPGNDVLAAIASGLVDEALLASAVDSLGEPGGSAGGPDRLLRHQMAGLLISILEQRAGLTFRDPTLPFVALPNNVAEHGGPLGGYLRDRPGYGPFDWAIDLFARWDVHHQVVADWRGRGSDRETVRADSRTLEAARLLRAALYYCWWVPAADAVATATAFVTEVAAAGLCRHSEGAGLAFAMLLRAGAAARTPESLARTFFGELPTEEREWAKLPLNFPPAPVPLTAETLNAVNSLVIRANSLVDQVREADSFDAWFTALAHAGCLANCAYYALQWATPRLPLGLRVVQSQFSEHDADYASILALLNFRGGSMEPIVGLFRNKAARFRNLGDTTGDRFARERLLIPRRLLDSRGALPPEWRGPSWRTVSTVPRAQPLDGLPPEHAVVARPEIAANWGALAAKLTIRGAPEAAWIADLMADRCPA